MKCSRKFLSFPLENLNGKLIFDIFSPIFSSSEGCWKIFRLLLFPFCGLWGALPLCQGMSDPLSYLFSPPRTPYNVTALTPCLILTGTPCGWGWPLHPPAPTYGFLLQFFRGVSFSAQVGGGGDWFTHIWFPPYSPSANISMYGPIGVEWEVSHPLKLLILLPDLLIFPCDCFISLNDFFRFVIISFNSIVNFYSLHFNSLLQIMWLNPFSDLQQLPFSSL